jgi:hypothetical protein
MNNSEDEMWDELNSALTQLRFNKSQIKMTYILLYLLNHGMIESGVDEDGEIVFWMTEEQLEKFRSQLGQECPKRGPAAPP